MCKPFVLDLDNEKIIIKTNPKIFNNLRILQNSENNLGALMNSTIAYPALYMVIENMLESSSEYCDRRWFVAIKNKLNEIRKRKGESAFEIDPDGYEGRSGQSISDYAWELVSELLTDSKGQLMVVGFEKAGQYGERNN